MHKETAQKENKARNPGIRKLTTLLLALILAVGILSGCGSAKAPASATGSNAAAPEEGPAISGLTYESTLPLERATEFSVYHYAEDYDLIDIHDQQRFLLVPEGG